jgi:DNA-binding response OmpR family regulator
MFASGLERRRLRVLTATDATAARKLASDERPDLAIVELRLGSTSGIELIRAMKTERPQLLVALISVEVG